MDKNMANRMCCDLDIRDYYTKAPVMYVDYCNTNTYGFTSNSIYAYKNGARYVRFDSPVEGNISITFQVHPFKIYSLLNNGSISTDGILTRNESITATTDGKLQLKYAPIMGTVFVYTNNDFTGREIEGSIIGKTFTAKNLTDIKTNETYFVGYLEKKNNGIKRISFSNSNYLSTYFIQMITTSKTEDCEESALRLTVYKCCPKYELDLAFSSDGSPAEITMSFECFQDMDGNVMELIELDEDDDSLDETEDIWINFETGMLETYSSAYYIQNGYLYQYKEDY